MESIRGSFLPGATQKDERAGGSPAERRALAGGQERGCGGWQGKHNKGVSRSEASASHMSDEVSTNEKPGERVGPTEPPRQKEQIRECPCQERCQRAWLQSPQDREFNLAFSLAEIFGINKRISLESTLLHSESSFTRVGRGKTLTQASEV